MPRCAPRPHLPDGVGLTVTANPILAYDGKFQKQVADAGIHVFTFSSVFKWDGPNKYDFADTSVFNPLSTSRNGVYVTGMYVDDENSERSADYAIFNTTIGVDITIGRASVLFSAGLHNMFDRTHAAFININSTSKDFYEAGEPRNFFTGLSLGYSL